MLHNYKLLASCDEIEIESYYIIRRYEQKSAQVGNSGRERCMVCAQILTMSVLTEGWLVDAGWWSSVQSEKKAPKHLSSNRTVCEPCNPLHSMPNII